jgi:hypothetical protein
MRFSEISRSDTEHQRFLNTVTLYVLENEWDCLQAILKQHGPAEITAVSPLWRFSGQSVDVRCQSPEAASTLLGEWHGHSVERLSRDAAQEEIRKDRVRRV